MPRPQRAVSSLAQTATLDRARPEVRAGAAVCTRAAVAAVLALVIVAPFERVLGTVPGGLTVTTVEGVVIAALLLAAAGFWISRPTLLWPRRVVIAGAAFLATLFAAATAAPVEQGHAVRFAARMATAALVAAFTSCAIDTERRARLVVRTMLAVASAVSVVAVLEATEQPAVMAALTIFRPGFHVVAGQLRATGTLFYPTIASMYFEIAFALGLWLLLDPDRARPARERRAAFVALAMVGAGIAATFTRAGLIGMAAALLLTGTIRLTRVRAWDAGATRLAALAVVLAAIVRVSHSPDLLLTRVSTEGSQAWYGARYRVPSTLALETGRIHEIPVTLTNAGRLAWDSSREPAFAMSYHWLRSGSEAVVQYDGLRTPFPQPVRPGQTITLPVFVESPAEPGRYTLVWDVVHETRAWLSTEGVPPATTEVRVAGAPAGTVATVMARLPGGGMKPARTELWRAAVAIWRDHPWLGVGPDNFRHVYGPYLRAGHHDPRIHANNMYLDLLAGAGAAGLIALLGLVAATGLTLARRCRAAPVSGVAAAAAGLAAWLMVAGHGLVDSFLSFTTTYVTFAIACGLALSPGFTRAAMAEPETAPATGSPDADCV
jgi:hypothetical protein